MKIRQLRSVIALAEELNFTRAAERCNIGQPGLTRIVADLESELGVSLFHRDKRRVALTPQGVGFVASARAALQELERGVQRVRTGRAHAELRVTMDEYAYGTVLGPILRRYRQTSPEVQIIPVSDNGLARVDVLRARQADVGVMSLPANLTGLESELLARESLCVYLPFQHPLASRTHLTSQDLVGLTLLAFDATSSKATHEHVTQAVAAAMPYAAVRWLGRDAPAPSMREMWRLIAAGEGVHLGLAAVGRCLGLPPSLVARPLVGPNAHVDLVVAWSVTDARIARFMEVLRLFRDVTPDQRYSSTDPVWPPAPAPKLTVAV
ncbi:LysR family transcriptional regulator [Deinococcus apachensis]|uniref:LysR family transcriptional regulator n=1 Tax=Deinococcus apachensis TaxID=309886 RepID=UPI00037C911A|nr:LysR substrate-binding domain-containing protein [Deinococcus apachensis]